MNYLALKAYAKINLVLEVIGKRDDGYHEIKTVFQTVTLFDDITIEDSTDVQVTFINGNGIDPQNNLINKAVELIHREMDCKSGVNITVTKQIPVGSGLGGGSADAAAILKGLNLMWNLHLTKTRLRSMASKLGADVPYFLEGGLAIGIGKGDSVRALSYEPDIFFVLVDVPHGLTEKTKRLYQTLTPSHYTSGVNVDSFVTLSRKQVFSFDSIYNVFTRLAESSFPELSYYKKHLYQLGCKHVSLSGTGPVLFAPIKSKDVAIGVRDGLLLKGIRAYCVQAINPKGAING